MKQEEESFQVMDQEEVIRAIKIITDACEEKKVTKVAGAFAMILILNEMEKKDGMKIQFNYFKPGEKN